MVRKKMEYVGEKRMGVMFRRCIIMARCHKMKFWWRYIDMMICDPRCVNGGKCHKAGNDGRVRIWIL